MKIYSKILSEGSKRQTVIHFPPEIRPGVKTLANPAFNSGFLFCTRDISYHFSATTKYVSPVLDPESPPCAPSLGVTESQTGSKMHEQEKPARKFCFRSQVRWQRALSGSAAPLTAHTGGGLHDSLEAMLFLRSLHQ